jgi:glycosyltransferase involved in cell wall biosynthesis
MIVDGQTGFLIPPRDAGALAAALRRLIEDKALRESYGRAGRDRAATTFSVPAHAAQVQRVYDEVLAARRLRAAS